MPDESGKVVYYIINYEPSGFLILAGDKRSEPVLAYSGHNKFPLQLINYPTGLVDWLIGQKDYIKKIRVENKLRNKNVAEKWDNLLKGNIDISTYEPIESISNAREPAEESDCTQYSVQSGPLLSTAWGQGVGFNDN